MITWRCPAWFPFCLRPCHPAEKLWVWLVSTCSVFIRGQSVIGGTHFLSQLLWHFSLVHFSGSSYFLYSLLLSALCNEPASRLWENPGWRISLDHKLCCLFYYFLWLLSAAWHVESYNTFLLVIKKEFAVLVTGIVAFGCLHSCLHNNEITGNPLIPKS